MGTSNTPPSKGYAIFAPAYIAKHKINSMKKLVFLLLLNISGIVFLYGQNSKPNEYEQKAIAALIDRYSEARDKSDTVLLKSILASDIDQLVSSGEWRKGMGAAVQGMLKSSGNNPGDRTLSVESIRMFNPATAIVDCRYEIKNADGVTRKMWSAFIVVADKGVWKISAIRNMLPST
jgi:uncharacterized protein (TIGR02246 family)